jgi:uncharacterized protein (TIGR04141 family)
VKLSCYLLRESQKPSKVLRGTSAEVRYYRGIGAQGWERAGSLAESQEVTNRLAVIYRTTAQDTSDWQTMVGAWEEAIDPDSNDFALEARQDRGAVFLVKVGDPARWFAWAFGRAWRYLLQSKMDPRFGVISALNDLGTGEEEAVYRKLQVRRDVGVPQVVGRTTFGDAPIGAFDLDEVWDAIKSIGGRTADGRMVYGSMSFVESHPISEPNELENLSTQIRERFEKTRYRERFGFLDQYIPVSDEDTIAELDAHVAEALVEDPTSAAFAYPTGTASFGSRDMAIIVCFPRETRANGRKAIGSGAIAQNERLRDSHGNLNLDSMLRFYADDGFETRASLRECLATQFTYENVAYVLADGVYYEVERDFVASLDAFLSQRIATLGGAPIYRSNGEDAWLDEAAATGQFLKIHPATYVPGDQVGKVELADIIAEDGRLLHVKFGANATASAEVSRQAISSAESLLMYPGTRAWLGAKQCAPPFVGLESTLDTLPRPNLGIVILGRNGDDLSRISLFAKLSLERAVRHLEGRDFGVGIYFVPKELGD